MTVNQFEIQVTPPERTNVAWLNPIDNVLRFYIDGEWKKLSDKDTPQEQADWNQSDNTKVDFIKNKPAVPSVVQETGTSQQDVMSQKAVTDIIGDVETLLAAI